MRLRILNLTNETIFFLDGRDGSLHTPSPAVLPSSVTLHIPNLSRRSKLTLIPSSNRYPNTSKEKPEADSPNAFVLPVKNISSASWKVIPVPAALSWRIFCSKISRKCHRLFIFPRRDLSAFLSVMPNSTPLSSLLLPGTHDTMAFYGWPVSQCQSPTTPLAVQLQSGIRALDIRLAVIESRLVAYHGIFPERTPFQDILSAIHSFLTAPTTCRETIVMSIKQEDFERTPPPTFSQVVHKEIFTGPGGREMWFLENRIPALGEVRGKVVMLSRFGGDGDGWEGGLEGLGIHPTTWPDSSKSGFSWQCKDTLVQTHDWYRIPSFLSIPEKFALATSVLPPPPNNPPMPTLAITYFSAASIPFALPPIVAQGFGWPKWGLGVEGINSRIGQWLLDMHDIRSNILAKQQNQVGYGRVSVRGWVFMDYYEDPEDSVIPLLVECNFRG